MALYAVAVPTTRPDLTRDEIERQLSIVFHQPVQVRQLRSKAS
jgi:hypothetical protein